jgi:hypothetical protein
MRMIRIFGVAILLCGLVPVSAGAEEAATGADTPSIVATNHHSRARDQSAAQPRVKQALDKVETRLVHRPVKHATVSVAKPAAEPPHETLPVLPPETLTDQERGVLEFAAEHGDQEFLMVDKTLGKILLFENSEPVFVANALTGASSADRMPPRELAEKMSQLTGVAAKITPAGRFTVTRGFDKAYGGTVLDIREIQGKDWGIAIHQVYLGIPSEHRAARLLSPRDDDKNITFGCINVSPDAMKLILHELPRKGATALYVLPRDPTRTAAYFEPSNS